MEIGGTQCMLCAPAKQVLALERRLYGIIRLCRVEGSEGCFACASHQVNTYRLSRSF